MNTNYKILSKDNFQYINNMTMIWNILVFGVDIDENDAPYAEIKEESIYDHSVNLKTVKNFNQVVSELTSSFHWDLIIIEIRRDNDIPQVEKLQDFIKGLRADRNKILRIILITDIEELLNDAQIYKSEYFISEVILITERRLLLLKAIKNALLNYNELVFLNRNIIEEKEKNEKLVKNYKPLIPEKLLQFFEREKKFDLKNLPDKEHEAVILFSDIRRFTSHSANLGDKDTLLFLNKYYGGLAKEILANSGIIDKYNGDGIIAYFIVANGQNSPKNAAKDKREAANNALKAATSMIKNLEELKRDENFKNILIKAKTEDIKMGIGLHFGTILICTLGNEVRYDLTAVGKALNTASRIEPMTKIFSTEIVFTEDLKKCLKETDNIKKRLIGEIIPKGLEEKEECKRIYEIINEIPKPSNSSDTQSSKIIENACKHFKQEEYNKVLTCVKGLQKMDHIRICYEEKCKQCEEMKNSIDGKKITELKPIYEKLRSFQI